MKSFLSSIALATLRKKAKIRVQQEKFATKRKTSNEFYFIVEQIQIRTGII